MDRQYTFLCSILLGIACSIFFLLAHVAHAEEASFDSPVGYWKTIDDVTGQPKSIVHIWRTADNQLMGKVIKIYTKQDINPEKIICKACLGDKHNQPIVGMVILSELTSTKQQWGNGKILDLYNGKNYRCAIRTLEHGKKLNVRGYIGLPLLGRSQTWERVDFMS